MVTESLLDRPTTRPALGSLPRRGVVGLVLVLASALALLPGASQPYPMAKAAVAAVGAALVLSLRRRCGIPVWITIWIAVAIVALLIAALMSENPMAAVFGRFPRYEGVWVVTTYLAVLAAGARLRFWRNARNLWNARSRWLPWWCAPSRHFSNSSPRVAIGSSRCLATRVISVRGQPSSRWC